MDIGIKDLGHAAVFLAVAEASSFSAAGRRLGITGSAVGQTVKQIEEKLGLQLFQRTTRSVVLTEQGKRLLDDLAPAMQGVRDALKSAQDNSNEPLGKIRVHAPRTAAERFILPMLARFMMDYPRLEVDVTVSNATHDLLEGGFDVAIRIGEFISNDTVAAKLGTDLRQLAVASPTFIERHGSPAHPRELVHYPCIGWRWHDGDYPYGWEFFEDGNWFSIHVNGRVVLTDRQLVTRLTLDGAGIAFLSEDDVEPYLNSGQLVNLLDPWCARFPGWHVCYSRQRHLSRATRVFIDAVQHAAASSRER